MARMVLFIGMFGASIDMYLTTILFINFPTEILNLRTLWTRIIILLNPKDQRLEIYVVV